VILTSINDHIFSEIGISMVFFKEPLMIPPNKHLIALINYITLVPLVYFIPQWLNPYLPANEFLQVCVVVAVIVVIISYIVMPFTLKVLKSRTNISSK